MAGLSIVQCKEPGCRADIVYVPIRKKDGELAKKPHPFDAHPHADGAYLIKDGEARRARIFCGNESWDCPATGTEHCCAEDLACKRYITHFATCTNASQFRGRTKNQGTR